MAGTVLESKLSAPRRNGVAFAVAGDADDADLRRLLRENPMPGSIRLSLEREPSYFSDANLPDETKQTIVAREAGRVVCAGSCTVRRRFVNGSPQRVGYLGGLRLENRQAGRFDILQRGYQFFRELQTDFPANFYFTSIAAENERARRFLERGLPGMPRYEFLGGFVSLLLPSQRGPRPAIPAPASAPAAHELVGRLNDHARDRQFAPCWSAAGLAALGTLGLQEHHFHFVHRHGRVAGSAALWDQRGFRQVVLRGYRPWLGTLRPLLNGAARVIGRSRLPAPGETIASAFVSFLNIDPEPPGILTALITEMRRIAALQRLEFLTLGFAASDPRLTLLRRHFRCREYHSRLYVVRWPGLGEAAGELDGRILDPEVALL